MTVNTVAGGDRAQIGPAVLAGESPEALIGIQGAAKIEGRKKGKTPLLVDKQGTLKVLVAERDNSKAGMTPVQLANQIVRRQEEGENAILPTMTR